jgi:hypothetical protein
MLVFWGCAARRRPTVDRPAHRRQPAGGPKYTPELLGQALPLTPRLTALGVFCSVLALGLIFCVGIWLLAAAATRRTQRASAGRAAPGSNVAYLQPRFLPPPSARPVHQPIPRPKGGERPPRDDRAWRVAS